MILRASIETKDNNIPINFLNFSVKNYLSARILYINNQLHDAGIMSHEAIEKIMKALLYFKEPKLDLSSLHNLKSLVNNLIGKFKMEELKGSHDLFEYYEECYAYRYPDDNHPKSFSTGTKMYKLLDSIYFYFHEECMKEINGLSNQNINGIYSECNSYFRSNDKSDIKKIIFDNDNFDEAYINKAKNFWLSQGFYVKDDNGYTKFPNGSVTRDF